MNYDKILIVENLLLYEIQVYNRTYDVFKKLTQLIITNEMKKHKFRKSMRNNLH